MQDAKKAKEWASKIGYQPCSYEPEEVEVAKFIFGLPDQIIDANKVQELADQLVEEAGDFASEVLADRYMAIAKRLRDTLASSLPTLAELIDAGNDPQKYQWMQCRIGGASRMGMITGYDEVGEFEYCTSVTFRDEADTWFDPSLVIPLPDLPRHAWPVNPADTITAESVEVRPLSELSPADEGGPEA